MTAKEVKFGDSARKKLANGVNILANAVKTCLLYTSDAADDP